MVNHPQQDSTRSDSSERVIAFHDPADRKSLLDDPVALLARVQRGGKDAGLLLHDLYAKDVNRVVWRILGPDQEHDDIVNDIFLRVLEKIDRVRDADRLRAWVLRVAVNTVRDALRKRGTFRRYFKRSEIPIDNIHGGAVNYANRQLLARACRILTELRPHDRIAFSLYYFEGMTVEEVATTVEKSVPTIRRRLARAGERLKRHLARDPGFAEELAAYLSGGSNGR